MISATPLVVMLTNRKRNIANFPSNRQTMIRIMIIANPLEEFDDKRILFVVILNIEQQEEESS
jgi:hypothetical protein